MAVLPSKFQQLATKLLGDTFGAFAKDLTLKRTVPAQYPSPSTTVEQTGKATTLETDFAKFDGELIQTGDIIVVTEFQQWTTVKPRTDLTSVTYDGKAYQIVNYQADPAEATYTIQLRPL
jgi:hypothetical protein